MKLNLYRGQKEEEILRLIENTDKFSAKGESGSSPISIQIHKGLQEALKEVARGWISTYPHKRSIAMLKGVSPQLDFIRPALSREGLNIQNISLEELAANPSSESAALIGNKLKKDTLALFLCEDDPIFGQKFNLNYLLKYLDEKKVLAFVISYAAFHFEESWDWPWTYAVRCLVVDPERGILINGTRAKVDMGLWGIPHFNEKDAVNFVSALRSGSENQLVIENFEGLQPGGGRKYNFSRDRIYDRAVLTWSDLDGAAIVEWLNTHEEAKHIIQKFQDLDSARNPNDLPWETVSPNRWDSFELTQWFKNNQWSEELIQGTVVFDGRVISESLIRTLDICCAEIRALQS